jgi:hypothetical protein
MGRPRLERPHFCCHFRHDNHHDDKGDEMALPKRRLRTRRCLNCKRAFKLKKHGRVPVYCSGKCRNQAYLKLKFRGLDEVVSQTMTGHRMLLLNTIVRAEIWNILKECGLVTAPKPPPQKPKAKPSLRLVDDR